MNSIFLSYIKYRIILLLFYCISSGIFLAVQFLSGQQTSIALYTILLTGVFLLLFLIPDATHFYKKAKNLRQIAGLISQFQPDFPSPSNLLEESYTQIAQALYSHFLQSQEAIADANAKSQEYYTLWVHQIKTPISALRLILQNSPDTPEKAVIVQELFDIERYADLALQYAKIGSIASDLVIEHCDLAAIVHESVKKYALLFIYKKLKIEISPLSASVISDAKWLRFIVEQILSNAVKYTKKGGIHIYMEQERLVIEDTGMGIRPEDLPLIFEKGYTGYNGRVDNRASGIGLYLSKKAADSLSVQISAASALGKGTRVYLRFPKETEWIH